jgi:hypothetical protein
MIDAEKEHEQDFLNFNGLQVEGKQIVVEIARRPPGPRRNGDRHNVVGKGKGNNTQCRFFLQGRCTKPNCAYEHREQCKFFKNGSCKFKNNCRFAHISKRDNNGGKVEGSDILSTILKTLFPQLATVSKD